VTVPSRSRTKPGSTNRRPKVAGLRQHALAGTATGRPDTEPDDTLAGVDTVEAPETVDAPADDRETTTDTTTEAPAAEVAAPPADEPTTSPGAADTHETDDGRTDVGATASTSTLPATAAPEAPAEGTGADTGAADATDTAVPADASTTATTATGATTGTAATPADAATEGETSEAAAPVAPSRKRKRGTAMTPRPEAASAPTRGRHDTERTATPTRAAKPTRTGGRRTEPEPAPGRLARVRDALGRFGRSRALPVTLVVVTVVCLVLAALAFWQGREAWTEGPAANAAVVDVGGTAELVGQSREAVEKIFSYDFTRLDDSVDAARTMSTNPFTDRYLQVFDQTIRVPAQEQQLRQTATVVNIGVMTMRDDRAEVMALAQFSAQRTTTGQSTNAPGLLRLQLERIDGRWKLAELTPLTAPPPAPR
jgi:Mce-associated membrane protein